MTCFNDLSIGLLLQIFDYLSFTDLFQAFFGLQQRLNTAIRNYPACIDLSTMVNRNTLKSFSFPCRSLVVSSLDLQQFQMSYPLLTFTTLRAVTFKKINLLTLKSLIEQLPMKQLESLTIGRFTWHYYPKDMYKEVWSIVMASVSANRLRYLHLPYYIHHWDPKRLSFELSALKHLTLGYVSVNQMLAFMRHTPNLRRLKVCLVKSHKNLDRCDVSLLQLNHLTLNLQDEWSLEQLQQLLVICPHLKHWFLKLETRKETKTLLEPTAWQTLIEHSVSHLVSLQLRISYRVVYSDMNRHDLQASFHHTNYWFQRRPHCQVILYKFQQEIPLNNDSSPKMWRPASFLAI